MKEKWENLIANKIFTIYYNITIIIKFKILIVNNNFQFFFKKENGFFI